jgi:hypothetical protein
VYPMKHEVQALVAALAVLGAPAVVRAACEAEAPRDATVDASGATSIKVDAKAGSLRIEGRAGSGKVVVRGTACASDRDLLDGIRLVAERRGGVVHVEAVMPEREGWGGGWRTYAHLNLVIEVPEGAPLDVTDSSGDATIENVGALRIEDSSGELVIHRVRGDLSVDDSSGEIDIADVGGTVRVKDSSGEIKIREAGGVVIESDGSGGIDIANVRGSVLVKDDGSGGIEVQDVGGDLTVEEDGSGGVHHDGVKGRVRVAGRR